MNEGGKMVVVGAVGAGYWGKNIVRTFQTIKNCKLKYISDLDSKILEKYNDNSGTIKTTDYSDICADEEVNAVVIATPPISHHKIAKKALLAGKHVFIEKPMTLELKESKELVEIADDKGLKIMVGHLLLYHPCIETIKSYITSGEIGDLYYLYSQRLNLGKVRSDENALLSFAPHDISVAIYLIGKNPISVSACGQSYIQKDIEDVVFLNMLFPDGKTANVHVSWLDPHKVRKTTIVGSKKMVVFDDMESREKVKLYDKGVDIKGEYSSYSEYMSLRDGNIFIPAIKMNEPLKIECEHFVDCVENNKTPKSDGMNGLIVTYVLEAAQKSLKSGGLPITIDVKNN